MILTESSQEQSCLLDRARGAWERKAAEKLKGAMKQDQQQRSF